MICQTCKFWWPFEKKGRFSSKRVEVDRGVATEGQCRRNPIERSAWEEDRFPTAQANYWCGEYVKMGQANDKS